MPCFAKLVAIFLFFFVFQLKPSDSTVKPTVTFEYHLLVQSGTADNIQHDGNGTYQWRQGEFGACSVTCGGGNF